MSIDHVLLRRAWPKGYLAIRGVKTVGGWQCTTGPHCNLTFRVTLPD